jgi:hypothetical protein
MFDKLWIIINLATTYIYNNYLINHDLNELQTFYILFSLKIVGTLLYEHINLLFSFRIRKSFKIVNSINSY